MGSHGQTITGQAVNAIRCGLMSAKSGPNYSLVDAAKRPTIAELQRYAATWWWTAQTISACCATCNALDRCCKVSWT